MISTLLLFALRPLLVLSPHSRGGHCPLSCCWKSQSRLSSQPSLGPHPPPAGHPHLPTVRTGDWRERKTSTKLSSTWSTTSANWLRTRSSQQSSRQWCSSGPVSMSDNEGRHSHHLAGSSCVRDTSGTRTKTPRRLPRVSSWSGGFSSSFN